jgi:hypothetical protein
MSALPFFDTGLCAHLTVSLLHFLWQGLLITAAAAVTASVWYVSRRLTVEREICCDELVMAAGAEPTDYAELLIRETELSRRDRAAIPAPAAALSLGPKRSSAFVRRITRILGQADCSPVRLWSLWSLALGLIACLTVATCLAWT